MDGPSTTVTPGPRKQSLVTENGAQVTEYVVAAPGATAITDASPSVRCAPYR